MYSPSEINAKNHECIPGKCRGNVHYPNPAPEVTKNDLWDNVKMTTRFRYEGIDYSIQPCYNGFLSIFPDPESGYGMAYVRRSESGEMRGGYLGDAIEVSDNILDTLRILKHGDS